MAKYEVEVRAFVAAGRELRVVEGDSAPMIRGYAAVFNLISEDLGGFRELIQPGAFAEVLRVGADVRALWNHDANYVVGRTVNGTLRLVEDEFGLVYEADPPDTQWARDALTSIRRGDVSQSSFQFIVARGGDLWQEVEEGYVLRTITRFEELLDVSPVTFPAYPQTSTQARARFEEFMATAQGSGVRSGAAAMAQEHMAMLRRKLDLSEKEL